LHPCRRSATKNCKRKSPAGSTLVRCFRGADPLPPACRPLHIIIIGLSATLIRTLLFH
jgi:hypothetical protein